MVPEKKYISLQEASNHCDYSQEYLSLRARQGKLKSVKNGRNWVTTLEWLVGYIKDTEVVKAEIEKAKKEKQGNKVEQKIPVTIIEKVKITSVPENLPVENYFISDRKKINTKPSSPLVLSAFIILFFSSIIFGEKTIVQCLNSFNTASQITGNAGDVFIKESVFGVRETILSVRSFDDLAVQNISGKISQASLAVAVPNNPGPKNTISKILNLFTKNKTNIMQNNSSNSGTQNLTSKNILDINQIDRLEMRDQATGTVYCTWIEDGWWVKVQSACKDVPQKNLSNIAK